MRERCRTAHERIRHAKKAEPDQHHLTGLCDSKEWTLVDRTHILRIPSDIGKIAHCANPPHRHEISLPMLRL